MLIYWLEALGLELPLIPPVTLGRQSPGSPWRGGVPYLGLEHVYLASRDYQYNSKLHLLLLRRIDLLSDAL